MNPRRLLTTTSAVAVVVAMLPQSPATAEQQESAQRNGTMDSATWHWAERTPGGDAFRQYAPLIEVPLARGGSSVWAANWSVPPQTGRLTLRLSGLPEGVSVQGSKFPLSVPKPKRAQATACREIGNDVLCDVKRAAGTEGTTAVSFSAQKALPKRTSVTATLLANGTPVGGADEEFFLVGAERTPNEFFVTREGEALVTAGQPQVHKIAVYRLSGDGPLRMTDIVPTRLRSDVRIKGRGWDCRANSCVLLRDVAVGRPGPALGMLWQVENADVRAWPAIQGTTAHSARWWTRYTGGRLRQDTSLVGVKQPNRKKPQTAAQILAPSRRAMVDTQIYPLGPARIGGDGRYSVRVGNGGSQAAKQVRVRLNAPSHARITGVQHSAKWRCQADRCTWQGDLRPKKTLPPLKVLLRSRGTKASKEPFTTVVRWRSRGKRHTDTARERTAWLKPLRVAASATNRAVHAGSGITTQLMAEIGNTDGTQVHYRWRQTAGPAVSWRGPRSGSVSATTASARFTPPEVNKAARLRFQVTISGGGDRVTDTVSVKLRPSGDAARWQPRRATTVPPTPDEAANRLNRAADKRQIPTVVAAARARIEEPGVTVTSAGKRELLRLRGISGKKLRKVTWRLEGRKVSGQGRSIRVRVPESQKKSMRVTAQLRLTTGQRIDVGEVLLVKPRQPQRSQLTSATTTLCQAFALNESDTFTVGGLTLTANAVTPNGVCTDAGASVTITAADFQADGATISGLSLTMTSAGVTASVASVSLPGSTAIAVSGTLSATWSGSFSGSLTATGLFPYLPLPDGWAASSITITFAGADLSLSATATGPNDGQAVLTGDLNGDGSFSLSLSVQNAVQVAGYDGSSAMFGGSGSIARASGGGMTYDVQLAMSTSGLEILDNVTLGAASLQWNNSGLSLTGSVTTTIGTESVAFTAAAQITDATDWTATISTTATPSVGTLPLASLSGTFTYNKTLTFDVTATVSNVEVSGFLGLDISTASATIQNDNTDLELELAVAGSVVLFSDTIDVNTTVDVDITTGKFDADFSLAGAGFGPAEAQLTAVNFFVANDGASDPALTNNPCLPSGTSGTVYGFTATATILSEASFQVTGVYQGGSASNPAGSGYCFYGDVASSSISELNGTGVADSLNFLYATYATTAAGQSIPATSPTMWATMALPSQVQTYLNNDVTGFTVLIELITSSGKVTGLTINGDIDMSAYVAGSATSLPSFELTSIGVSLQLTLGTSDGVEISFDSDGVLTTPGNSVGSMAQSTMSFDASIGLQFGSSNGGGSLNLSANLQSNAPVSNAFGVSGLTLQQLGVSAVIGFDALLNSSLTFSATNLELPSNIADPIGLSSTAPIDFSLTVGITAPCFYISIGTPDQTTNAAIDWGGAGILEAYYFKLLLAPFGNCTESDGTQITGNFAVDFTGYIFGVTVDIDGMVEIVPEFSAYLDLTIGGFNLAGLDLDQTVIDLNFAPSEGVFDLNFSGGANLWSTVIIDVSGTVDVDLSATKSSFDIQFDGSMDANLFGIFQSEVWVDLGVDAGISNGSFYLNELDVSIGGLVKILIFEANASFTLDYDNGGVQVLTGDFAVNINLFILQFGVELAFQYDPAVTGNQDLAITISGYVELDLWLFDVRASVSITIDVDASFLGGSEYHPQPVQTVNAPTSLVTASPNTNPNSWTWNSGMYQGNNFGWMANLQGYANAINNAGDGGELGDYYPAVGAGQTPDPADVAWIQSQIWPGAYTANQTSSAFAVVPTKGTATIGETTDALDTYSELEVTATLPPSPLAGWWSTTVYEAQARGLTSTYIPDASCVTQNTTVTYDVRIPETPNPSPGNWAWVILDTNWRMFNATLAETQGAVINMFANGTGYTTAQGEAAESLASLQADYPWYDAPVPVPFLQSLLNTGDEFFECGYESFATQISLYDFMSQQGIPWERAAPPTYQPNTGYTSASQYNLNPGWGDGWDPYDLEGAEFNNDQAFNVQVSSSSLTCQAGSPLEPVNIQDVWWAGQQLWSDPTNGWVPIPQGEYLKLEFNGVTPGLHLYNSSNQELLWNGSSWQTGSGQPFSSGGQLIGADRNGVVYQSWEGHDTYLAFESDNPITAQMQAGNGDPSYTYQPEASLNQCQNGVPTFADPNNLGVLPAPDAPPSFPSVTTRVFGGKQVYLAGPNGNGGYPLIPTCTAGSGIWSFEMAAGAVTGSVGPAVDLVQTGWTLQVQNQSTLGLYNVANQEVRWLNSAWTTEPSGGWPSGAQPFITGATLYGGSVTGVMVQYGSTTLYLWFSPNNFIANPAGFGNLPGEWPYAPGIEMEMESALNNCSTGVYTGP